MCVLYSGNRPSSLKFRIDSHVKTFYLKQALVHHLFMKQTAGFMLKEKLAYTTIRAETAEKLKSKKGVL